MEVATKNARIFAALGTAMFLLLAPGTVAGLIPWWLCRWRMHAGFPGLAALRVPGALLISASLIVLLEAFVRFAGKGLGTPAPIYPTRHLVVTGSYRYVRNPMYIAVSALVLGQGLLFGSLPVLAYGLAVWLGTHLFVLFYEEPALKRAFPRDYAAFTANVPRWIPRWTPWNGQVS
jgi:protein-S-isoprenylcysteine O-methyltransferase Ste14